MLKVDHNQSVGSYFSVQNSPKLINNNLLFNIKFYGAETDDFKTEVISSSIVPNSYRVVIIHDRDSNSTEKHELFEKQLKMPFVQENSNKLMRVTVEYLSLDSKTTSFWDFENVN